MKPEFHFLIQYFRKYKKFYLLGVLSLMVVDSLEALPPLLLKSAVDGVAEMGYGSPLKHLLWRLALAYMAISGVQGLMRFFWRKYIIRTSMYASNDMRIELFYHLTSLAPAFFKKKRVGDLVSLSTNDIEAVRFALGPGALTFCDSLFYLITIPPIMFWISPKLTLLSFFPLLLVPLFVRRMEKIIQKHFRNVQGRFSVLASNCQESLGGIRLIKSGALENFKEREFARLGNDCVDANLQAVTAQSTLTVGLETIISISTTILFLVGGTLVIGDKISIGVFVAFQRYIQKLSWPMEGIGLAANIFQKSIASQSRIAEVLAEQPTIIDPEIPLSLPLQEIPVIEVRDLSFTYPGAQTPTLKNLHFKILPGMRVGITGTVGSGKSTLLSCLSLTEPCPENTIFFSGIDIRKLSVTDVRKRIAFVPQESFLFSTSVEKNILYGSELFAVPDPEQRSSSAQEAAKLASVAQDIAHLEFGYQTRLGERGVNLSGGQRQRLTIARAIARKPQILILDDCLSAVDVETERSLVQGILKASQGITLLIASHRISSFRNLDWILYLKNGELAAQGTYSDLVGSQTGLTNLEREIERSETDLLV